MLAEGQLSAKYYRREVQQQLVYLEDVHGKVNIPTAMYKISGLTTFHGKPLTAFRKQHLCLAHLNPSKYGPVFLTPQGQIFQEI